MLASSSRLSGAALQIIGMSATLPNVQLLADRVSYMLVHRSVHRVNPCQPGPCAVFSKDWLGARLYVSNDRPVPLSLSVAVKGQVWTLGLVGLRPPVFPWNLLWSLLLTFRAT